MTSAYEDGYATGLFRREHPNFDPRHDLAAASKAGVFDEFLRGLKDGFDGKPKRP